MTKKHFIRAAEIVAAMDKNDDATHVVAYKFIELFSAYNDRFDRQRFLSACGL